MHPKIGLATNLAAVLLRGYAGICGERPVSAPNLLVSDSRRFCNGLRQDCFIDTATPQAGNQGLEIRALETLKILAQTAADISAYQRLVTGMTEHGRYELQIVDNIHRHAQRHGDHWPIFSQAFGNSLRVLHKAGVPAPLPGALR
jgi:hypothetical protein